MGLPSFTSPNGCTFGLTGELLPCSYNNSLFVKKTDDTLNVGWGEYFTSAETAFDAFVAVGTCNLNNLIVGFATRTPTEFTLDINVTNSEVTSSNTVVSSNFPGVLLDSITAQPSFVSGSAMRVSASLLTNQAYLVHVFVSGSVPSNNEVVISISGSSAGGIRAASCRGVDDQYGSGFSMTTFPETGLNWYSTVSNLSTLTSSQAIVSGAVSSEYSSSAPSIGIIESYSVYRTFSSIGPMLPITYAPSIILSAPSHSIVSGEISVTEGTDAPLVAHVSAFPRGITYAWYKDADLIPDETSSVYTISNMSSYGDAGVYTVQATNDIGTTSSSLTVLGA